MAWYKRYLSRFYRKYRKYRKYYKRSANSRFKSKIRKSVQQRDMFRVIVASKPIYSTLNFVAKSDASAGYLTPIIYFTPMQNLFGYTILNPSQTVARLGSFSNFAKLFDQVKINAVRLKISVTSVPAPSTNAAISIKQCLDKNGINTGFAAKLIAQLNSSTIAPIETATTEMESYSSFYSRIVNQNDLYSIYKTFIPSGIQQKGFWYGCSYKPEYATQNNVVIPDLTTPWKPIFMIQFDTPSLAANGGNTIGFNYQWEYDVTFKGQRQWTDVAPNTLSLQQAVE